MQDQRIEKTNVNVKYIKFILILIGLVAVVLAAIFVSNKRAQAPLTPEPIISNQVEEVSEVPDASTPIDSEELKDVDIPGIDGAKAVLEGGNAITPDNKVVTATGKVAENIVLPMSENAPRQSGFLDKENLAKGVVQLEVGNNKFSPNEFSTQADSPTTFALTSIDKRSHVISFDDPALNAIAILVGPGQTKAITFNAPATPGTYEFHCAAPEHAARGEKGKMTVK